MTLNNPPKALILLVALICITLLLSLGKITNDAGLPLISAIVFFAIENGVTAVSGKPSEPIIGPK